MPVVNIFDKRSNKYDVHCDVVFEPAWHDNSIEGATRFPELRVSMLEECRSLYRTTIGAAIEEVRAVPLPLTMFVYDFGSEPLMPERSDL